MKKIKLGPCPFCGGKAIFESTRAEAAALNARFQSRDDREKAASAWNQRYSGDRDGNTQEE